MIDVHCHIDLYKDPLRIAEESEKLGITTIGMTLLPSKFELFYKNFINFKYVHLALGMHPLKSEFHEEEYGKFITNLEKTLFLGEIGLDYSKKGLLTKEDQVKTFKRILSALNNKRKILSIHSRKAEEDVLNMLILNKIPLAIFHWYSGPISLIREILQAGYYFSINTEMINSGNGEKVVNCIPRNRILTESDGPTTKLNGNSILPKDMIIMQNYLAKLWGTSIKIVNKIVDDNYNRLFRNVNS